MNGINITHHRIENMAKLVAYVPQEHKPPFPYLVKEVVLMGRTPHLRGVFGISRKDKERAQDALDVLEIAHFADQPYNQLSGGQRQMVVMARAIAQDTKIRFLDEPTSALDFSNQIRIWEIMRRVAEEGGHNPCLQPRSKPRILVLQQGGGDEQKRDRRRGRASPRDHRAGSRRDLPRDLHSEKDLGDTRMVMPRNVAERGDQEIFIKSRCGKKSPMSAEVKGYL